MARTRTSSSLRSLAIVPFFALAAGGASGCGALLAGGAGAGAAVYMTSRGAESQVNVSVDRAYAATLAVLRARDIVVESEHLDDGGAERDIDAQLGDLDIDISLRAVDSSVTDIDVKASRMPLGRDNDYAAALLSDIVGAANTGRVSVIADEPQPWVANTVPQRRRSVSARLGALARAGSSGQDIPPPSRPV